MDRWNIFSNGVYCNEYERDILGTLKECERLRMTVRYVSPQLKHRRATVRLIETVCEKQFYRRATLHLAIYLLDVFMSNHTIHERSLSLVALTCLYVACKIEENDPNVPSLIKLNGFLANAYAPADFIAMEVTILTFFDWHITIPTASTFQDIFSLNSFTQEDYNDMPKDITTEQTSVEMFKKTVNETSDIVLKNSLQHLRLCNMTPSLLAASCVAAGRFNIDNLPIWNERLASVTGYKYYQIHPICQLLLFEAFPLSTSFPTIVPAPLPSIIDAGYLSEWSTDSDDNVCSSNSQSSSINTEDSDNTVSSFIGSEATITPSANDTGEPSAKKRKIVVFDWSSDQSNKVL